jgi:hypothetical protein
VADLVGTTLVVTDTAPDIPPSLTVNKGGGVAVSVFGTLSTNGFLTVKGDPSPESGFAVTSGRATFAQDVIVSGAITIGKDATFDGNITVRGTGDITFVNGDVAEEFNVVDGCGAEPGTVMVLEDETALRRSDREYDQKVVGVISGAGSYKPALLLDRQDGVVDRVPVALMGKVFCKVDASSGPIEVGDLLTTSVTPGHAMKASDTSRAFGAVIGKALRPMPSGRGMIPILIALQ